jgi:hypothetical protein
VRASERWREQRHVDASRANSRQCASRGDYGRPAARGLLRHDVPPVGAAERVPRSDLLRRDLAAGQWFMCHELIVDVAPDDVAGHVPARAQRERAGFVRRDVGLTRADAVISELALLLRYVLRTSADRDEYVASLRASGALPLRVDGAAHARLSPRLAETPPGAKRADAILERHEPRTALVGYGDQHFVVDAGVDVGDWMYSVTVANKTEHTYSAIAVGLQANHGASPVTPRHRRNAWRAAHLGHLTGGGGTQQRRVGLHGTARPGVR